MMMLELRIILLLIFTTTTTGFVSHSTRPHSWSKHTCWASSKKVPSSTRGMSKVSEIMDVLQTRYNNNDGSTATSEWTKTRNYLYQTSERLTLDQVNDVLKVLEEEFSPAIVRSILTTCPRVLRRNVKTKLNPTIQFLRDLYGHELFCEAISRNPHLLISSGVGYGAANPEMDRLLQDVGLSKRDIASLRKKAPFLFRVDKTKVEEVVDFLGNILEKGDYDDKSRRRILTKIIISHPALMNLSVKTNLEPRMVFLMERCSLEERDVATLLKSSSGNVLGLSVDDNLRPKLDFLSSLLTREERDLEDVDVLRKCVLRHPQLIALSLKNLQEKVKYFDAIDQLGEDTMTLACRVAIRSPAAYSLSLKSNIIPTVEFLAKVWGTRSPTIEWMEDKLIVKDVSLPDDEGEESLSSRLKEYPSILTMSLEGNIQPTLTFYNRTGYTRLDEDWNFQRDKKNARPIRGRYIGASLFNRLLPRWHHLIANGWSVGQEECDDLSTLPPLHLLVATTDRAFCEQMGYDFEEYVAFKDEAVPRLKFSSQFATWLKTGRPIDIQ